MKTLFLGLLLLVPKVLGQGLPFPGVYGVISVPFTISQLTGSSATAVGSVAALYRAQSFTVAQSAGVHVTTVTVNLEKSGSPSDNIVVSLYTHNSGFAAPGTLIANSTTTLVGSTLTTSFVAHTFSFSNVALASGKFWIVITRSSGTGDNTNFYNAAFTATSAYPNGGIENSPSGTSWSAESTVNDLVFTVAGVTP